MSQTIDCHCGLPVRYAEEDRGFDVYCPSCGLAVAVPAAEEAVASPAVASPDAPSPDAAEPPDAHGHAAAEAAPPAGPPRAEALPAAPVAVAPPPAAARRGPNSGGVFSAAGRDAVIRRTTKETLCLCGRAIGYTLEDYGSIIYCTCGNEIRIGEELDRRQVGRAKAVDETALPPPRVRFRWVRSRAGFTGMMLILTLSCVGGYYAATLPGMPFAPVENVETVVKKPVTGGPVKEFDPTKLQTPMIEKLAEQSDYYGALKQALAWRQAMAEAKVASDDPRFALIAGVIGDILGRRARDVEAAVTKLAGAADPKKAFDELDEWARVLRGCGVDDGDERLKLLRKIGNQLTERIDPITLVMIDGLLTSGEALESLRQGQMWRETLEDRDASKDDPRFGRLDGVIVQLRERLVPRAKPRPWIEEFRGHTKTLSERLLAEDLDGARRTRDRCEALLNEHPDDLGPLAPRYMSLKSHLRTLELEIEGMKRILALFGEAESAAADSNLDRLSDGSAARDMARHLVRFTPMTPDEANSLDERLAALKPKYQLALGRRAVRDAVRCDKAGDAAARDHQARRAAALLPGLPEDQIRGEMTTVRPWITDQEGNPKKWVAGAKPSTAVGREVLARDLFEAAMEQFGVGDTAALAAGCKTYQHETAQAEAVNPAHLVRLKEAMFDALEVQITRRLDAASAADDPQEKLVQARAALDTADFWKDEPRWKTLDGALRQRGEQMGRDAADRAVKLVEQGDYETAVVVITPALSLGDSASMERARALRDLWQVEVQRRADQAAEEAQWALIGLLVGDPTKPLEAALELKTFLERYPSSSHADDARGHQGKLRRPIDAAFAGAAAEAGKHMDADRWPDALKHVQELEAAASGEAQTAVLEPLRKRVTDKKTALEREFRELGVRKNMIGASDTLAVLRVTGTLTLIEPTHAEAVTLAEKARKRGAVLAAALLRTSKGLKNLNPEKFKEDMQNAYWLDPYGEAGREARRLLTEGSTNS